MAAAPAAAPVAARSNARWQWLVVPLILLATWQVLAWSIEYAVIGPVSTITAIERGWERGWLLPSFASTLKATAIGFALSASLGVCFGFLLVTGGKLLYDSVTRLI